MSDTDISISVVLPVFLSLNIQVFVQDFVLQTRVLQRFGKEFVLNSHELQRVNTVDHLRKSSDLETVFLRPTNLRSDWTALTPWLLLSQWGVNVMYRSEIRNKTKPKHSLTEINTLIWEFFCRNGNSFTET